MTYFVKWEWRREDGKLLWYACDKHATSEEAEKQVDFLLSLGSQNVRIEETSQQTGRWHLVEAWDGKPAYWSHKP